MPKKDFKKGLAECIRAGGHMMIENAEDIAGKMGFLTNLEISFTFDQDCGSIPEMTIKRSHMPNREQVDKIFNAFYVNEKTDTSNDSFLNKSFNIKEDK